MSQNGHVKHIPIFVYNGAAANLVRMDLIPQYLTYPARMLLRQVRECGQAIRAVSLKQLVNGKEVN